MRTSPRSRSSTRSRRQPRSRGFNAAALLRSNARCARNLWGTLSRQSLTRLADLTKTYQLSISAGHLQFLDGGGTSRTPVSSVWLSATAVPESERWSRSSSVTQGLNAGCSRQQFTSPAARRVSSATVTPIPRTRLPSSVAPRCALPRREPSTELSAKAYGIGLCSVEELGSFSAPQAPVAPRAAFEWPCGHERLKQRPASIA